VALEAELVRQKEESKAILARQAIVAEGLQLF
jgi:hypothetical protein